MSDLKNLKASQSALAELGSVFLELGKRIQEVGFLLDPAGRVPKLPDSKQLVDVVNEMLLAKAANASQPYMTQLRHTMVLFCRTRHHRPIGSIPPQEIEEWSTTNGWADATRRTKLIDTRTLFSFALDREYIAKSPFQSITIPEMDEREPFVHHPREVKKLLDTAHAMDLDLMRKLALEYFGGFRPWSEAAKFDEWNIMPKPGLVEVKAKKSKTRKRRLVTIPRNLKAWLKEGGELPIVNLRNRWRAVRKASGVPWGHDVIRHTFCSFHYAFHKNAALTADQSGHSEEVFYERYRAVRCHTGELITYKLAKEYFAIMP